MNRKERRRLEKQLGIKKPKNLKDFGEKVRRNIEQGKHTQDLMRDNVRRQKGEMDDKHISDLIASKATEFIVQEGISYIDALEKARNFYAEKENDSNK